MATTIAHNFRKTVNVILLLLSDMYVCIYKYTCKMNDVVASWVAITCQIFMGP